jgi:N-acetylglutamate synthase-like GNAT family acetyltransferase
MITKTQYSDTLAPFSKTVFGCRIQSAAAAYGVNEPFAQFWTQEGKAALCKLDDVLILDDNGADFDELKEFIAMTGANRLLCDLSAAKKLGLPVAVHGQIMFYRAKQPARPSTVFELNPSLREVHALLSLCATDTFLTPEFESFYMDMSHRIRHNTAVAVGVRQSETLVACAICSAHTADSAVISAVAVSPALRHKGFGYTALTALIAQLPQKDIYIFREETENEEFYRAFGFAPCGGFAELTI